MSSPTTASPRPPTTSSGSRGKRGRYPSGTLPPAAHVSHKPEMVGTRYGWVEIISPEKRWGPKWRTCYVLTRCTGCGYEQWQHLGNLTRGVSKGCQPCSQPRTIPLWLDRRLTAAKQRCTNPDDPGYPHYGGRGIEFRFPSVTEAGLWVMDNLGLEKPKELDRIDNDGHYETGNIRWATRTQQSLNQRRSVMPQGWDPDAWPYSRPVVTRKLAAGMTREEIIADAEKAVAERRKNWRGIQAKLASMTC